MMFTFHTGGPRPKRAKISIACNVCKARKTRCDGARPGCGPCAKRKQGSQLCRYREEESVHSHFTPEKEVNTQTHLEYDNHSPVVPRGSLFGASSGPHILHDAGHSACPTSAKRSPAQPRPLKELPRLQKRNSKKELPDVQFAIPPRKVADHLLNLYWDFVDSAYPWLDRASIESAYETLWSNDGEAEPTMDERALHCILNLMFATSCVASQGEPPLSRYQSSVVSFDRAQELMSYGLMEIYSFEIIQILLLTAKCFRNIGTAIHIVQELGLHVPETTKAISDPRERGLARQVWNGCVIMDRICAMTSRCALKVPQSLAKQGLNPLTLNSMEASQESENTALPSKVNFYISFCRLHHIIGEVLEIFYISRDDTDSHPSRDGNAPPYFDKFASLFRIESELNHWAANLDPFFQMPSDIQDSTPTKHITREANILRARLYSDNPQVMPHVVLHCQLNCVKAAGDMIEFIARNLPEQTQAYILPSNWYTVSYVYMAVAILLAAKTSRSRQLKEHLSTTRLNSLLQCARDILKGYESHTTLASRCSSVLKLIDENIDARRADSGIDNVPLPVDSGLQGTIDSTNNNSLTVQSDQSMSGPETQEGLDSLAWVQNYAFDWNDWPTFFAQLDEEATPVQGWGMQRMSLP
ncbi:hypothetical protein BJX76DRAFT_363952 [Aspergillus varians]